MVDINHTDIELVALDIDGTLLAPGVHHKAVPERRMTDAVAKLKQAGVTVVLASGRMYPGTRHVADHLGITEPLICQQGASVHDLDGTLLHSCSIDQGIAREIAAFARNEDLPYAWFDSQRYLVSKPNPAAQYFGDVSGIEVEHHPDPADSGLVATGIDIISDVERSSEVYAHFDERFGDKIELLNFTTVTAAHSIDAHKANALERFANERGIARENVVAVGDSVNDVSMLSWAGLGASPAHCDDYARAASDLILPGEHTKQAADVNQVAALLESIARRV